MPLKSKNTTNRIKSMVKHSRLLALDVMRGITIAGMILVNNPGNWGYVYAPLKHAFWNGLTPTDLVFPFFMFIMGVSMFFSLEKYDSGLNRALLGKILKRTVIIFFIGVLLTWFAQLCYSVFDMNSPKALLYRIQDGALSFNNLRLLGVMQRLAISYCISSLLFVLIKPRYFLFVAFLIIGVYYLILRLGSGFYLSDDNIIIIIDKLLLGSNHMYTERLPDGSSISFDPEGLLSTIPCLSQVMFGMFVGRYIRMEKENINRISSIFIFGTIILFIGFLLSYEIPINKKIWSPTYVLVTCGYASLLLGLLIWLIDMKQIKRWSVFFESFGINPLFMYVLGTIFSILFDALPLPVSTGYASMRNLIYGFFLTWGMTPYLASFLYAVLFITFNWIFGYGLYKRRIYIKI